MGGDGCVTRRPRITPGERGLVTGASSTLGAPTPSIVGVIGNVRHFGMHCT